MTSGGAPDRPLDGVSVVLTRAAHQQAQAAEAFTSLGATVIGLPVIAIGPPADGGAALAAALGRLDTYDWVVVTSANAASLVAGALLRPLPVTVRVAAVGGRTAERLAAHGVAVDLVPEQFVAEALVERFPPGDGRVLYPAAAGARDVIPEGLRAKGWHVDVVEAYRTVPVAPPARDVARALDADAVLFTSPSTVSAYLEATGGRARPRLAVCIGPVTGSAATDAGFDVVTARHHTVAGAAQALVEAIGRIAR